MQKTRKRKGFQSTSYQTNTMVEQTTAIAKQDMSPEYYELIYDPERVRGLGMQPRRYTRAGELENSPSGVGIVPLTGKWIIPGRNKMPASEWNHIKDDPEVKDFLRRNIYQLIVPQASTGTLADFAEEDALELIHYSYDSETLEVELHQEKRTEVLKAIKEQIKANQEKMSNSGISLASIG